MTKRFQSITDKLYPLVGVAVIVLIWQVICSLRLLPEFVLPSPGRVTSAFVTSFPELMRHSRVSLSEAAIGLFSGVTLAFLLAIWMDASKIAKKTLYPILVTSQTIPVVAIAPLLVLWLGYGMLPKVVLIILVCFFPVSVGLVGGLASVDSDMLGLLRAMGATKRQLLWHVKLPQALPEFFSGLKIAVSYSVVGAVIAEWLGGAAGLGVYMTRVRKSYAFDKMFAVILLISAISLLLMWLVSYLEKKALPWNKLG